MLVPILIAAGLVLIVVAAVAAWQVAAQDRAGRVATAERIIELIRNEGLSIGPIEERDGRSIIALHAQGDGLASRAADSPAGEDQA